MEKGSKRSRGREAVENRWGGLIDDAEKVDSKDRIGMG